MLNFNSGLGLFADSQVHVDRAEVPMVQERVTVTPLAEVAPAPAPEPEPPAAPTPNGTAIPTFHIPESTSALPWEKLRDYVIEQILAIHGPFPRDIRRENTIFMGFAARWEDLAMPIARYAFETAEGMWIGAPVSTHRFEKASDGIFAQAIAATL